VARRDKEKIQEVSEHEILVRTSPASFEMKLDVWISTIAPSRAKIAPPETLYVPRRELEQFFKIVLFLENARVEPKSNANES
jgi:hypothetical protein